jgi:hypothetical protein
VIGLEFPVLRFLYSISIEVKVALEQAMKMQKGKQGCKYFSFNFGARWGWVINATLQPLYPH